MGPGTPGKVYLVGAGPGAADLLTVRAARLIEGADIVFHDALVSEEILALARHAELMSVGKRHGRHSAAQDRINAQMIEAAARHRVVVRLKGGDPMLFGRAQEEIDALRGAGIEYEVVPGVSAAFAASAVLGVSLTRRGIARSVVFVTPRVGEGEGPSRWADAARGADTVVLYMAAHEAPAVAQALIKSGRDPGMPVAILENISLADEKRQFRLLGELARTDAGRMGPALLLVGEICREAMHGAQPGN